jgi:autotransporter translocation and assembly factor TamB
MSEQTTGAIEIEVVLEEAKALVLVDPRKQELVTTLHDVAERLAVHQYKADAALVRVQSDADAAAADCDRMAADKKAVEAATKDWKEQAFKFHRRITGFCNLFTDPLDASYKKLKGKIMVFETAKVQAAEAEARRLQAIADEKARQEQAALLKKADKLNPEKSAEKIEALREQAAAVQAPVISAAPQQKTAVRMSMRWDVRLPINEDLFFKAVGDDPTLRGYVDVAVSKLARAKASNTRLEVPGVTFYQKPV